MKKLLLLLTVLTLGQTSLALSAERTHITSTTAVSLKAETPVIGLSLPYPGKELSGLCGAEIRTSTGEITALAQAIRVLKDSGVEPVAFLSNDRKSILIDLTAASGTFVTEFSLHTIDGRNFVDVINSTLGEGVDVILIGARCSQ